MLNALIQEMQMKGRLELGTIIGLNSFNLERQSSGRVVLEPDGRLHVAVGIEPGHPEPGAIIDGGEPVELLAPAAAGKGIDERDVNVDLMSG